MGAEQVERVLAEGDSCCVRVGDRTTLLRFHHPETGQILTRSSCTDRVNYDHGVGRAACERELRRWLWLLLAHPEVRGSD